jgi:hypothetical protein
MDNPENGIETVLQYYNHKIYLDINNLEDLVLCDGTSIERGILCSHKVPDTSVGTSDTTETVKSPKTSVEDCDGEDSRYSSSTRFTVMKRSSSL